MSEELTGRALDMRLAEAFGWVDFWESGDGLYLMGYPPEELAMGIEAERAPVPPYSSTWEGLGLVVEEMERRGFGLTMICHAGDATECEFYRWPDSAKGSGDGASAPEAVSRAALKALGEER